MGVFVVSKTQLFGNLWINDIPKVCDLSFTIYEVDGDFATTRCLGTGFHKPKQMGPQTLNNIYFGTIVFQFSTRLKRHA